MEVSSSLWVPNDNSTLSNLPRGLQRYTGEQDFFLVVANMSTSMHANVPYPWGGTSYNLYANNSTESQLVNFLVPRGQFLGSVMGQALLNNSALPQATWATGYPDGISGETLPWLSCYWQGHAVAQGSQAVHLCTSQPTTTWSAGTPVGSPHFVTSYADTENCTNDLTTSLNCQGGGVPSEPSLAMESPGNAAPAIQAVITLNLTSSQDLTYLLAGLMDNNTTMSVLNGHHNYYSEGLNGFFLPVTGQLSTLGLSQVVLNALANTTQPNSGIFGAPYTFAVPATFLPHIHSLLHPADIFSFFSGLWNSFSGMMLAIGKAVLYDLKGAAGVVWNAWVAAAVYFAHIGKGLAHILAQGAQWVVKTTVTGLEEVRTALEAALQALLKFVKDAIETLLKPIVRAITSSMGTYVSSLWADFRSLWSDHNNSKTPNPSEVFPLINDLLGQTPIFVALGLGVLVEIAFGIASVLVPGTSFVEDAIESVMIGTVLSSFIGFLSNLIPSIFMSPGLISAAWYFYNVTGGGSHPSIAILGSSPVCGGIIETLLAAFGSALAGYQFYGDMTGARYMLDLLVTARTTPGFQVALLPTLSFVMDAVSLLIALLTLPPPLGIIQGGMAHVMNIIGLGLGVLGLLIGGYALLFKRSALAELPGLLATTITGEAVGAVGTTANLVQVAAGC